MAKINPVQWSADLGYITLRGLEVNGGSTTVIAIHGYLDNANSMIGLADAFVGSRYIALDLAGHGQSDHRPAGMHYNQMDYVQDLHQLIQQLDCGPVVLVGHSLGGIIASIYAAVFPENISALVSIDALGPLVKAPDTTTEQLRDALSSRHLRMTTGNPKPASLERAVKSRAALTDLPVDLCQLILSRNLRVDEAGNEVWQSDPRVQTKSWMRMTGEQAQDILSNIVCPVLIVGASSSFKTLASVFDERQSWLPQAIYKQLEGGHHIHLERKQETVNAIAEFVSNL